MTDYPSIISSIIEKLPRGTDRFSVSEYSLSYACLGHIEGPHFGERLTSDYGVDSGDKEIEKDFFEEIDSLENAISEADVKIDLAKWQKSKIKSMNKLYKGMNRRALAIQLWNCYAIPWRYKNGLIHLIWSPTDIYGTPIIHSLSVPDFLAIYAKAEESRMHELNVLLKKHIIWYGLALGGIIFLSVLIWRAF